VAEKKEYAVVYFLEQGGQCYKIDDVTEGCNLLQFIKEERIEKKELYVWFASLSEQLELYHKNAGRGYGHVNPYAVIINEEGKAVLLDVEAKENNELLKRMQKKNFRSLFVKKEYSIGQQAKPGDDVYGFGKLLLFLLEKGKFEMKFTLFERIKLKRITEKCINNEENAEKVLKRMKRELRKMESSKRFRRILWVKIIVLGTVIITGLGIFMALNDHSTGKVQEEVIPETEKAILSGAEGERFVLELGLLYYTELEDSVGAREILNHVKENSKAAEIYLQILDYVQKGSGLEEESWDEMWQELKDEWIRLGAENKLWYKLPVLEACKIKNTTESWNMVCEIGEEAEENRIWNGIADYPENEILICSYLSEAYEKLGEEEKALHTYETWKQLEVEPEQMEQIYLKVLDLSEKVKDVENEPEIMRTLLEEALEKVQGIEEHTEFSEWMEKYTEQETSAEETDLENVETITESEE